MSDSDLIEKVSNEVAKLCKTGGKSFRMCAPVDVNDTDMLFCEMIRRFRLYSTAPTGDKPDEG